MGLSYDSSCSGGPAAFSLSLSLSRIYFARWCITYITQTCRGPSGTSAMHHLRLTPPSAAGALHHQRHRRIHTHHPTSFNFFTFHSEAKLACLSGLSLLLSIHPPTGFREIYRAFYFLFLLSCSPSPEYDAGDAARINYTYTRAGPNCPCPAIDTARLRSPVGAGSNALVCLPNFFIRVLGSRAGKFFNE